MSRHLQIPFRWPVTCVVALVGTVALASALSGDACDVVAARMVLLILGAALSIGVGAFLVLDVRVRRLWMSLVAAGTVSVSVGIGAWIVGFLRWVSNCTN